MVRRGTGCSLLLSFSFLDLNAISSRTKVVVDVVVLELNRESSLEDDTIRIWDGLALAILRSGNGTNWEL